MSSVPAAALITRTRALPADGGWRSSAITSIATFFSRLRLGALSSPRASGKITSV